MEEQLERMPIFEELIRKNRISLEVNKVKSNPIIAEESGTARVDHYRCQLSRPGRQMEAFLSVESSNDLLTLPEVFFMLAMDASGCELLDGLGQYMGEWTAVFGGSDGNMQEMDNFWQEYQGRCKQNEAFRSFLGDSDYEKLVKQFNSEGFRKGLYF